MPKTPIKTTVRPKQDVTDRRREMVEQWWIEGMNVTDILRRLERETGHTWSRMTIYKDLRAMRKQWEREGSKRSRDGVRGELERMSRLIFQRALERKRTAIRKEMVPGEETVGKDGRKRVSKPRVVTTTVLLADPDLAAANRAVERLAALHGLNVQTYEGSLSVKGLVDALNIDEPADFDPTTGLDYE